MDLVARIVHPAPHDDVALIAFAVLKRALGQALVGRKTLSREDHGGNIYRFCKHRIGIAGVKGGNGQDAGSMHGNVDGRMLPVGQVLRLCNQRGFPFPPRAIPHSLRRMLDDLSYWDALAALEWQVELGADEAIMDLPVDRFDLPAPVVVPKAAVVAAKVATPAQPAVPDVDTVAIARQLAESAGSLDVLRAALDGFEHCAIKRGARSLVFSDGVPSARVMVIGDAPRKDEDQAGKPFVSREGALLDKMFAAIGLDRSVDSAGGLYLSAMLPWRPPQDREPKPEELAMLVPFMRRHIELAAPDVLVLMGNHPCMGLLGKGGIGRLRGQWAEVLGVPAMPMLHPGALLRNPASKREAWADLLAIKARLGHTDE